MTGRIPQVKSLTTRDAFVARLAEIGVELPVAADAPGPDSALSRPLEVPLGPGIAPVAPNRFTVLPMEGWDGTVDGHPTELVTRRWERFGRSGAGLIWGGEAVAVTPEGRANPHQLTLHTDGHVEGLAGLREALLAAPGCAEDVVVGLQLTHSGRFARPGADGPRPMIPGPHPVLDARLPADAPVVVLTDAMLEELAGQFVEAARRARDAGFAFVDVKACHGYLGHELLAGIDRPGPFGGDLLGRTRFARTVIEGIRRDVPGLGIAMRLSTFDVLPHHAGADGRGEPDTVPGGGPYRHGFGTDASGLGPDLDEPVALLDLLAGLDVHTICVTAGSPYYCPHVQRPAYFPPSDGYQPPEDPLVGVARLVVAAAELKARRPETVIVGSGYSYLQEWLPQVADAVVASGGADSIGVGRMALSYPELPADVLAGRALDRRRICRTFSDCTTAPRAGLVSGCYPLDEHYKAMPERIELAAVKKRLRAAARGSD